MRLLPKSHPCQRRSGQDKNRAQGDGYLVRSGCIGDSAAQGGADERRQTVPEKTDGIEPGKKADSEHLHHRGRVDHKASAKSYACEQYGREHQGRFGREQEEEQEP